MYFNVVGSFAFEGSQPAVQITVTYFDNVKNLALEYDSASGAFTVHPELAIGNDTNSWSQKTWTVVDAFFGNRQSKGADFRIRRQGEGVFYLDVVTVAKAPLGPPAPVSAPNPPNGGSNVSAQSELQWSSGVGAASHDVYFGTSTPPAFQGNQTATVFDPGTLAAETTYSWRIDGVNDAGTTTGPQWSFTTGSALTRPTLNIKPAGTIVVDGKQGDWNLSEFSSKVWGGDVISGDRIRGRRKRNRLLRGESH